MVVELSNLHHVNCTRSYWREWVQLGPTYGEAVFGRCWRSKERLETAGAGFSRPQKRHRFLWLAKDLKCPSYSLNQRAGHWKSAPYALNYVFYARKCPIIRQNNAWEKSFRRTVLMNAFRGLKMFLVVVQASNVYHVSCTRGIRQHWVQLGPTSSEAIFGRCYRNQERLETAGAGCSAPQKRQRSLWLAEDLKCPNYSLNQRYAMKKCTICFRTFSLPKVSSNSAKYGLRKIVL